MCSYRLCMYYTRRAIFSGATSNDAIARDVSKLASVLNSRLVVEAPLPRCFGIIAKAAA